MCCFHAINSAFSDVCPNEKTRGLQNGFFKCGVETKLAKYYFINSTSRYIHQNIHDTGLIQSDSENTLADTPFGRIITCSGKTSHISMPWGSLWKFLIYLCQ